MIVDGKKLSEEFRDRLKKEILAFGRKPKLAVIFLGGDQASESFIKRKEKFAGEIGAGLEIFKPGEEIWKSRVKLREYISKIVHDRKNSGVIIQLPLPEKIKQRTEYLLDAIPADKDADVLSSEALGKFANGRLAIMPPVAGAIKHILDSNRIDFHGKKIAVVGASGRLVGRPVVLWLSSMNIPFSALTEESPEEEFKRVIREADIIISGAGKAGLIKKDMVKEGVIAIDAGVSSGEGGLAGDFEPAVADKASFFTPVPGGIGPLTVAVLFKNLLVLAGKK